MKISSTTAKILAKHLSNAYFEADTTPGASRVEVAHAFNLIRTDLQEKDLDVCRIFYKTFMESDKND